MTRLSLGMLDALPPRVRRPGYDVGAQRIGIVHLGIGAFHRAHQAVYVDDRLAAGERGWAILGASLRSPDTRDALEPQDGLYTVAVRSGEGDRLRVIGAVRKLLVAPEDPGALLAAMCDPGTRIVSLTVTEKGYCHDPASGELDQNHADIRADLASPDRPRSAPGFLVEALRRRRAAGTPPFTVLCCDNLPANGETVRRVLAALGELRDPDLGAFIEHEVAFPSTMVDRIVPATTDADRAMVRAAITLDDAWPVMTEPFSQWVIEDAFGPLGRPRLEEAGAQLVADVAPFELMKLRLLNGSHSTLAYLGYLAGYATVAETMADGAFARLVERLMAEVTETLPVAPGADVTRYRAALIDRFRNPALKHRTWQIAMDGSQKLPQRLLGTARDRLADGAPVGLLALGVAGWMRYVTGIDEAGQPIEVKDPLSARLRAITDAAGPVAERLAPALMGVAEIFGEDLPKDPRFTGPVTAALAKLFADGAAPTVRAAVAG
jgi:fructuronate reductase